MSYPTDSSKSVSVPARRQSARTVARLSLWCFDHWVLVMALLFGALVITPFLAPLFMWLGWTGPAQWVYASYSMLCHQMAQRSFFLFGAQPMYNIAALPVKLTGNEFADTLALRNFIGNASLGWKVAWSDRMVYLYGGAWLAMLIFGAVRNRAIRPLRLPFVALLMLPIVIDGGTHFISDMGGGLVGGFRYSNQWLANLTGYALPDWFYVGDAFGSFNAWMRLISGVLFGVAVVWFAFPYLDSNLRESAAILRAKLSGQQPEAV